MSMKAEMEMANKLLEKDVHQKRDTIVSLRDQLEEIKNINLELYTKLQVYAIKCTYANNILTENAFLLPPPSLSSLAQFISHFLALARIAQECEIEISQKSEIVSKLEQKTRDISKMLDRLSSSGQQHR